MADSPYKNDIEDKLKTKTRGLGLDCIKLGRSIRRDLTTDVLVRQMVRCGTSVGANYRSACRAKSKADMLAKLAIFEEEADECIFWLEMLTDAGSLTPEHAERQIAASNEILALVVASMKTLRRQLPPGRVIREARKAYGEDLVDLRLS